MTDYNPVPGIIADIRAAQAAKAKEPFQSDLIDQLRAIQQAQPRGYMFEDDPAFEDHYDMSDINVATRS